MCGDHDDNVRLSLEKMGSPPHVRGPLISKHFIGENQGSPHVGPRLSDSEGVVRLGSPACAGTTKV